MKTAPLIRPRATGGPSAGTLKTSALLSVLLLAISPTSTPSSAEESTVAPDGYRLVELGETVELDGGDTLTASRYEEDVSFAVETAVGSMSGAANLFWVEMCAGAAPLESFAAEPFFQLLRPVAMGWESTNESGYLFPGIREPRLNDQMLPKTVEAGACQQGWVVVGAPDSEIAFPGATAIGFDSSQGGFTPEDLHFKLAWALE